MTVDHKYLSETFDKMMASKKKPADIDLRAAVLEGIDQRIKELSSLSLYADDLPALAKNALTALRHLREIVERHEPTQVELAGETVTVCTGCVGPVPCPVLRSLAPDYAPQALAEMEADRDR